jgi:cell volume regulation protein A
VGDEQVVLAVGVVLLIGVAAAAIADRLQVPAFALCLIAGMAIGSDGAGLLPFHDHLTAQRIGMACVALILFDGGWKSNVSEMRSVWGAATRLAIPGTVVTALVTGIAITLLLRRPIVEALLIGSILAPTDGPAVFGLLRRIGLQRRLARTLEVEAGMNDPVAILLVISVVSWMQHSGGRPSDIIVLLGRDLVLGLLMGLIVGIAGSVAFRSRWLPFDGLYAVISVALGALAFGAAETLNGSGLMAVYVAALVLGSGARQSHKATTVFQDGLGSLADIALFLTLGLIVVPSQLQVAAPEGVAIAVIVAIIARPVAVFAMTSGDAFSQRERVLLSWAGLRGAMPLILATIPITEGLPNSLGYFNVVFVVVLVSAMLQGSTIQQLTRMLGLNAASTSLPDALADAEMSRTGVLEATYLVSPTSDVVGRHARDLHLPTGAGLSVIVRSGYSFSPDNSTRIRVGDVLHFVVATELAEVLHAHLANWGESAWPPQVSAPAPAPEARWAPFQRRALQAQGAGLIARERLWWRELPIRVHLAAMRLWAMGGRRS